MKLFIDTHFSKKFSIAAQNNEKLQIVYGTNAAKELISIINELTNGNISEIIIIKGPGSLTGLRIGSAYAMGIACGKNIPIKAISIWDILLNEFPNCTVFFYTGTKKWIKKTQTKEEIIEKEFICNGSWISNKSELINLPLENNIPYPELIQLMPKYINYATLDTKLLYPITMF